MQGFLVLAADAAMASTTSPLPAAAATALLSGYCFILEVLHVDQVVQG
jgi:hypothetical protein